MSIRDHHPPDVEAEVTYLTSEAGGRSTPALNGYRPCHLVRDDYLTSGHHEYLEKDEVLPGETARTHIWFLAPHAYPRTLWVGKVINVQEGNRIVGHAKITEIFNPLLIAAI